MMSMSFSAPKAPVGTMDYNPDEFDSVSLSTRLPNPPFEFPNRSSFDTTSDYVPAPLPAFSFNPGNLHASSPSTSTITASRPTGHRRRPSELIGGEGPPSPQMLSSSPVNTNGENTSLLPSAMNTAPSGPRRGHVHRRSQAMSSMDLTALKLVAPPPPPPLTVGSAPTTPADKKYEFQNQVTRPMSRSAIDLLPQSTSQSTSPSSPTKPTWLRPTVAFEEKRPRPLSMISMETSSSLSTVRPNHSRVNSAALNNIVDVPSTEAIKPRPKTADATLLVAKPSKSSEHLSEMPFLRRSSIGLGPLGPLSLRRHSSDKEDVLENEPVKEKKKPKKKKKNKKKKRKDAKKATSEEQENQPDANISERALDSTQGPVAEKWESASSFNSRSGAEDNSHPDKTDECQKKQKTKVRTWAGAIFPLKSKRTQVKRPLSRRSPTPPPILTRSNSDKRSVEVNFDEDNTVIIRTPTNPNMPDHEVAEAGDKAFENSWKPRSFYEQDIQNDTFLSPVIDLDAALGPFNTPEMGDGKVAGSSFSQATKRMYSGGRRGEFVGPEMRYHRRAESAPEMPPFDRSFLNGFHRSGSDNAMAVADVFYEEEEDAFLAENQPRAVEKHSNSEMSNVEVSSVIDEEDEENFPSSSETLQAVIRQPPPTSIITSHDDALGIRVAEEDVAIDDGPGDAVIEEDEEDVVGEIEDNGASLNHQVRNKKSVEIVEVDQWTPQRVIHHSNSPDLSPRILSIEKRPCSSPLDLNSGLSQLTLPSRHASSSAFPSPDPSNMSFEGPRSATASSMTDHTTFNHPYHDQRQSSFEDVPSLSSSASTRTNPRGRFSSSFYPQMSGERPESFNILPPRSSHSGTTKRASLVSLSRLVSSSYGEKSKLSHEEKPPADETEKSRRKSRRISRLMFWRPKDKQNTL